jgi:hypothetical protein
MFVPSRYGFTLGQIIVLRVVGIILGVALLAVAGVLMAAHLSTLLGRRTRRR